MKIYRTPSQAYYEFIEFCLKNKKTPNQNSSNPYEKSLARCIANYKKKKKQGKPSFSDEQFNVIEQYQSIYSPRSLQKKSHEKINILKEFCKKNNRWPSQKSTDSFERKIYEICCREKYYKNYPELLKEYNLLNKTYITYISPNEVFYDLSNWVKNHDTTPKENSGDIVEKRLAEKIKYLKNRNKFSPEQLKEMELIYDKYGSRGGTSIYEQIIYHFLKETIDFGLVYNGDTQHFGFEVDVLVEREFKIFAIYYDGYFFHNSIDSQNKDNSINNKLSKENVTVLRFREEGCPKLNNCITIPVRKDISYQEFLDYIIEYFKNSKCSINNLILSMEEIDKSKILNDACIAGSSKYLVRKHLLNYINQCLINDISPNSTSKESRNCKAYNQRNKFSYKEYLLYAFTKRLYDSSPRKTKQNSIPTPINNDIELLYLIFETFLKNTPYEPQKLKKELIDKINGLC